MRRAKAEHLRSTLARQGLALSPVRIEGRAITSTFWGDAWCDNLTHYSDFANRLPRGRSYVRNGLVLDLRIEPGRALALVSGAALYDVSIGVAALPAPRWKALCAACAGAIDSLVELLQGRLSNAVMSRLCDPRTGLFPAPNEITFACSCPDGAWMCKHVAAVLYGIGARLDTQPALLFTLRQVEQQQLVANAGADLSATGRRVAGDRVLVADDLAALFGIDFADGPASPTAAPASPRKASAKPRPKKKTKKNAKKTTKKAKR
jgi:uncharacterized Zn finger protein